MDFVVKLGETGLAFTYSNISSSEKVSFLQEQIKRDTKIEPKEQVLFSKKGYKLHADETLSTLEKENNLQSTMTRIDPSTRTVYTIIVFDLKRVSTENKSSSSSTPLFTETNEDLRNYLIDEKIIDKDYSSALQSELDQTNSENIKKVNPNILSAEAKMFGHFLIIKKSFLQYVSRLRKMDRLLKESENQLSSFDVLVKHASIVYNPCKSKKNDITKKFINQSEKNSGTIKKFEESIENLKKIELHESLKTDKLKTLLDIYYDTDAMYKWRNSCVDFQSGVKLKIEKISAVIKSLKQKIKDERDLSINSTHPAFQTIKQSAESCNQEALIGNFKKVYEEYKSIRDAIEAYIFSSSSTNEEILKDEKWTKMVERELDEDRKAFIEQIERAEKILEQLVKIKGAFENQVGQCYRTLSKHNQELHTLEKDKLKQLNDDIEKMDKDFNYLLNPSLLPAAYQASLIEVNRRRDFAVTFDKSIKKLQTILDTEIEQRKKFLSQYGRILPCQFIPQFKNMPPSLSIQNHDADNGLPKIEGLIPKENTDKEDSQVEELERLNKELKLKIRRLEDENETRALKKKFDDLLRDFENERDRNKALKAKVAEYEKDRLAISFRRNDSNSSSKESDYESMKADFDNLAKIAMNAVSSLENQENIVPNLEHKNSRDSQNVEKLTQRIVCLNSVLNQTVKTSFDIFFKKLNDKQKKYDESKSKFESLLQRGEEDLNKEKSKLTLFYEEKIQDLNEKYSDTQRKLEDAKRYQKEVLDLKKELNDKEKNHQKNLESIKQDIKGKLDLLKNKDEIIKSLNSFIEGQSNQITDLREKLDKETQKLKLEHHDVLNNIHSIHKQEIEKLKSKIKSLENDISNKNIELDKLTHTQSLAEKDSKLKEDQIQKLSTQVEALNKKVSKNNDDIAAYKNKFDNMELTIQNKTTDINGLNKQVSTLTTERNQLQDDLSKYKQFNNETNKRLQTLSDSLRKLESEKVQTKAEMEKLELEIEKKNIEINNLKEQMEKITNERKQQLEEITKKTTETQESEKSKNAELVAEKNELNTQLTALKTQKELISFDLDNKTKENENLIQKIKLLQSEKDELNEKLSKLSESSSSDKERVSSLDNEIQSLKSQIEKLQTEIEFKNKHTADIEKNLRSAYERYSNLEEKTQNLEKENEVLKKEQDALRSQSDERDTIEKSKSSELLFKINLLEQEVNKKNLEIENLTSQIQRNNEDLDFLRERKSNLESSLSQKEEIISNLEKQAFQTQNILKDLQNQEDSYTQDVKLKDKEIQELNEEKAEITKTLETLKAELSEAQNLLSKERESYEKQLSQKKQDAKSKIDYLKVEKGSRNLFIPYAPGIYVPFSMHQYTEKEINNVLNGTSLEFEKSVYQNPEKSIRTSFFLDVDSLSQNYQEVLKNFSLLIVGTIKEIAPKMNKEIDANKDSLMVKLENIDYMIGFEDEDMVMKNYV